MKKLKYQTSFFSSRKIIKKISFIFWLVKLGKNRNNVGQVFNILFV